MPRTEGSTLVEFPPDVRGARTELERFLTGADWAGDVDEVLLAVQEGLINADRHGGGLQAVRARLLDHRLEIEIADRGGVFTPAPYVAMEPDPLAERGRGLWIIDSVTDSFEVIDHAGHATLVMRFAAGSAGPSQQEPSPAIPSLAELGVEVLTAVGAVAMTVDAHMVVRETVGATESLFGISDTALRGRDLRAVTAELRTRFAEPVAYEDAVLHSFAHLDTAITNVLVLVDGRVVRVHSRPLHVAGIATGRLTLYLPLLEHRELATALQEALLPAPPQWAEFEVGAVYHPAQASAFVGGDFYDFIEPSPGVHCVVVGDVSGRGPAAAAMGSRVRAYLRSALATSGVTGAMQTVEEALASDFGDEDFVSLTVAVQESSQVWTLLVAGHPPALLLRGDTVTETAATGPLLGQSIPDAQWAREPFVLAPGDTLVLYTDGVVDAGRGADRFGTHRLGSALQEIGNDLPAQALVEALDERVHTFAMQQICDDHVLVAIRRKPTTAPTTPATTA